MAPKCTYLSELLDEYVIIYGTKAMGNVYISGESRPDKKLYQADDR